VKWCEGSQRNQLLELGKGWEDANLKMVQDTRICSRASRPGPSSLNSRCDWWDIWHLKESPLMGEHLMCNLKRLRVFFIMRNGATSACSL
jgi:hypothetical protein